MKFLLLLNKIVIEFPDNKYILTVNKSPESVYEHVTLESSYKQTASYLFRWFRNMKSSCNKENAEEKVSKMITVFDTCKNELFVSLREYVLIEGILETSYRLQLANSQLICELLSLLYKCWFSFGPLHFKAILGRRNRRKGSNTTDLLSFFLEHASRKKLRYDGIRMIDVSIYSCFRKAAVILAADVWSWKQMLIYLQYGAQIETLQQDSSKSQYGVSSALTETLRTLIRHLWFRLVYPSTFLRLKDLDALTDYCAHLDTDVKNLCRTFKIMLRAIRRIPYGSLDYIIRDSDEHNAILMIPSRDVMSHFTVETMIPKLFKRYECPDELKHCCRFTIRKRLNENWQLPHGIQNLPVPDPIQRYLNLLMD